MLGTVETEEMWDKRLPTWSSGNDNTQSSGQHNLTTSQPHSFIKGTTRNTSDVPKDLANGEVKEGRAGQS